jgi:hypothetical protein
MNKEDLKLNIDLRNTQPILSPEGNQVFAEGVILRKISRFVSGTDEDAIMPIPVFYDIQTGKVLVDTLPKDLRAEFSDEQED